MEREPQPSLIETARQPERIALTPDMIARLRAENRRTGIGVYHLLDGAKDKPDGLTPVMITGWLSGAIATARPEHLAYALTRWSAAPTAGRKPLTRDMSVAIKAELARTGLNFVTVLADAPDCPPGLTWQNIRSWIYLTGRNVHEAHWAYVMARLRGFPDAPPQTASPTARVPDGEIWLPLTAEMIARLRVEKDRTGVGAIRLLEGAPDIPPGLTYHMIGNWLGGENMTVEAEHFNYALTRWAALPMKQRIPLTPEMIARLEAEKTRTGRGPSSLLWNAKDKPPGLTSSTIMAWLKGTIRRVDQEHFDYVLARWSALPDDNRRPLTPDMRAALNAEFIRTGLGATRLLQGAEDCPAGLAAPMIQSWLNGRANIGTVDGNYWDYVMERLRGFPDAPPSAPRKERVKLRYVGKAPIGEADLAELRHHRERTGIGGAVLLRTAKDKPEGLTPGMISGWLTGAVGIACPEYVAYALARYRAWP